MRTNPSKSFKVFDIAIQVGLIVVSFIWPKYLYTNILVVGALWQLVSYTFHRETNFRNEKESARGIYWKFTKITLFMLAGGLFLFLVGSSAEMLFPLAGLAVFMWAACLFLGVLLYLLYITICIIEVRYYNQIVPIPNNHSTYEN
jgi:hypothetical protein